MFGKILIANRGEIAVRIIKTCRRLGIATVVVYSEADAQSLAVEMADESVLIGPAPAAQSYLLADRIIEAAKWTGADAVHPGFGFLSENAGFARALEAAGLVFIGPNPAAIDAMGDKIESKRAAVRAGVSVVPGHVGEIDDTDHAVRIAEEIGYPVMLKASAGGGGKGIRIAYGRQDVEEGFPAVRAEAKASFGDDRIFIEKFIENPRHIEIQVLGDKHGTVLHLFERECSIQRRNQKVIEEAPSPLLDPETRAAMGAQAVALARAVAYDSAGTVEFVAGQDKSFYFLEMNTRLQVEHPVTELITGVDLVEQMIRVAAGAPLSFGQADLAINGWAMESRIYAEDPYRGFLPSIGRLIRYAPPAEHERPDSVVRNDAGVREGDEISIHYDPMISKLSTWAPTRIAAIDVMGEALERFHIEGPAHNVPFLAAVMDQRRFRDGALSTRYIADEFPDGFHGAHPTDRQRDLMCAVACAAHAVLTRRNARQARTDWIVIAGDKRTVRIGDLGDAALEIEILGEGRTLRLTGIDWRPGAPLFSAVLDGEAFAAELTPAAEGFVIRHRAAQSRILVLTPRSAELHEKLPPRLPADTSNLIVSPMPGLVVSLDVAPGQAVRAGQPVAVVEAMKMQNIIRAERDGVVRSVGAKAGDSVAADEVLVEFVTP
ncbi:acetyl-CoA carboxylase biotin carboxylase subunit [Phenylobacterium immobile]|uniref:acetyl-CoA carboxylase biotin carboxylase subunit n=1 Tax=Phenylobacterium immobile TaxID=21 RepID=UPI000AD497B7|nr:acetyl/propionyl/methylcrotonyl-CoA carboxylase subunit alpha [Phenylobacterium immobile]